MVNLVHTVTHIPSDFKRYEEYLVSLSEYRILKILIFMDVFIYLSKLYIYLYIYLTP